MSRSLLLNVALLVSPLPALHVPDASFVMTTVVEEDPSRPPWPSCPSDGWASGVDRLSSLPNGQPFAPRVSSRASTAPASLLPASPTKNCTFLYNVDIDHGSIGPSPPAATPNDCCALCTANATCWSATWYQGLCWMKGPSNNTSLFGGAVSCWPAGARFAKLCGRSRGHIVEIPSFMRRSPAATSPVPGSCAKSTTAAANGAS